MKIKTRQKKAKRLLTAIIVGLGGMIWLAVPVTAQGICVPEPLRVSVLSGKVVAQLEKGETPLSQASLALFRDRYEGPLVAETAGDAKGHFKFNRIRSGKYILTVTVPNLKQFSVRVRVRPSNAARRRQEIVVTIGAELTKPCGGSKAEVRTKK